MATTSSYQFQSGPVDYQKDPPKEPTPVTTPPDPNFIGNLQFTPSPYQQGMGPLSAAMKTGGQLTQSAQQAAMQQLERVNKYIGYLQQLRSIARQAAAAVGKRGGGQQQNPLAVHQAMADLANQASVPLDAEIQKALQGSNNVENTLNNFILQAGQLYAQLSRSAASGGGISIGGGNKNRVGGGGGQTGTYTDIQGNIYSVDPSGRRTLIQKDKNSGSEYVKNAPAFGGRQPKESTDMASDGGFNMPNTELAFNPNMNIESGQQQGGVDYSQFPGLSSMMAGLEQQAGQEAGMSMADGFNYAPSRVNAFDNNPNQFMADNSYPSENQNEFAFNEPSLSNDFSKLSL